MTSSLSWLRPRLAGLCGIKVDARGYVDGNFIQDFNTLVPKWRPDEDVAQAIRCLEAIPVGPGDETTIRRVQDIHNLDRNAWFVRVKRGYNQNTYVEPQSLPRAICLAIAASLNWKEEGETP